MGADGPAGGAVARVRQAEAEVLAARLAQAGNGRGGAVAVVGEAGAGKTWLCAGLGRVALEQRFRVVSVRAVASETTLTYGALHDVLEPLLDRSSILTEAHRRVLLTALGYDLGPPVEPLTLRVAALALLAAAAAARPLLVIVDDAHWLDEASWAVLQFCARRLAHDPVLLVFSMRPRPDRPPTADASGPDGTEVLELGPLPAPEREAVVRAVAGDGLSGAAVEAIVASSGNPLVLAETARTASGLVGMVHPMPAPMAVGAASPPLFGHRIDALPPATRRALGVRAADEAAPLDVFDAVLGHLGSDRSVLGPAVAAGLLEGERAVFCHPLAAAAALDALAASDRVVLHRLYAELWARQGDEERALRHREAAAAPPAAADYEHVAERARRRGAPGVAAAAYREAARLAVEPAVQARLLVRSAECSAQAAQHQDAARTLAELDGLDVTGDLLNDHALLRAQGLMWRGQLAEAQNVLTEAAEDVRLRDPLQAVLYLTEVVNLRVMAGDGTGALGVAEAALSIGRSGDGLAASFATATFARLLCLTGEGRVGRNGIRLMRSTLSVLYEFPASTALTGTAQILGWMEHDELAIEVFERARTDERLPIQERPFLLAGEADHAWRLGRPAAALARALEARDLAIELGHHAGYERANIARAAALLGRVELEPNAQAALQLADRAGIGSLGGAAAGALGSAALVDGRPEEAVRLLRRAMTYVTGGDPCVLRIEPELIEALLRLGDREAARVEQAAFAEAAARTRGRWIRAAAARCEAQLRSGDDADAAFEQAVALAEAEPSPIEQARAHLRWGESLLDRGDRVRAIDRLQRAATLYERAGAAPWAALADAALQRAGRRRDAARRLELSSHELQIAALVAEGLSNRQIAERLFVSPKTVEYHLGNIYRRHRFRSRVALTRAFLGQDGGPAVAGNR
ncbi:MAG: AAA family ATPase [Acidimicrobiia bacterium]